MPPNNKLERRRCAPLRFIDLLCLDHAGDIVVVELKRNKTTREITAQILHYGAWVKGLSNERITSIAETYLDQARWCPCASESASAGAAG